MPDSRDEFIRLLSKAQRISAESNRDAAILVLQEELAERFGINRTIAKGIAEDIATAKPDCFLRLMAAHEAPRPLAKSAGTLTLAQNSSLSNTSNTDVALTFSDSGTAAPSPAMHFFQKSGAFILAGPASLSVVDREGDMITGEALRKALPQLLKRGLLSLQHLDIAPGRILPEYVAPDGRVFKTEVRPVTDDDIAFYPLLRKEGIKPGTDALFIVAEVYDDNDYSRDVRKKLLSGELGAFSISGQATREKSRMVCDANSFSCKTVNVVEGLDLSATTLCRTGMCPGAGGVIISKSAEERAHWKSHQVPEQVVVLVGKEEVEANQAIERATAFLQKSGDNPALRAHLDLLYKSFPQLAPVQKELSSATGAEAPDQKALNPATSAEDPTDKAIPANLAVIGQAAGKVSAMTRDEQEALARKLPPAEYTGQKDKADNYDPDFPPLHKPGPCPSCHSPLSREGTSSQGLPEYVCTNYIECPGPPKVKDKSVPPPIAGTGTPPMGAVGAPTGVGGPMKAKPPCEACGKPSVVQVGMPLEGKGPVWACGPECKDKLLHPEFKAAVEGAELEGPVQQLGDDLNDAQEQVGEIADQAGIEAPPCACDVLKAERDEWRAKALEARLDRIAKAIPPRDAVPKGLPVAYPKHPTPSGTYRTPSDQASTKPPKMSADEAVYPMGSDRMRGSANRDTVPGSRARRTYGDVIVKTTCEECGQRPGMYGPQDGRTLCEVCAPEGKEKAATSPFRGRNTRTGEAYDSAMYAARERAMSDLYGAPAITAAPRPSAKAAGACGCSDPGCGAHKGASACAQSAKRTLHRVDMEDRTGTPMCDACADDAHGSGLFSEKAAPPPGADVTVLEPNEGEMHQGCSCEGTQCTCTSPGEPMPGAAPPQPPPEVPRAPGTGQPPKEEILPGSGEAGPQNPDMLEQEQGPATDDVIIAGPDSPDDNKPAAEPKQDDDVDVEERLERVGKAVGWEPNPVRLIAKDYDIKDLEARAERNTAAQDVIAEEDIIQKPVAKSACPYHVEEAYCMKCTPRELTEADAMKHHSEKFAKALGYIAAGSQTPDRDGCVTPSEHAHKVLFGLLGKRGFDEEYSRNCTSCFRFKAHVYSEPDLYFETISHRIAKGWAYTGILNQRDAIKLKKEWPLLAADIEKWRIAP